MMTTQVCLNVLYLITLISATPLSNGETLDIGPDTCGQDRLKLGEWFTTHGMPSLLEEPIPQLVHEVETNPYDDPSNPPSDPDAINEFCGMKWTNNTDPATGFRKYMLSNFPSEEATSAAGFNITHRGHCGACSSLQDLGVYISRNLTDSTRSCSVKGISSVEEATQCLQNLGFSEMCASIWQFNMEKTRQACLGPCLKAWLGKIPFNNPDGTLNKCLQCDEDNSGPNFKYFSGRTRRNSGIPSNVYRPPETMYNMTHCYWYGELA